MNIESNKNFEGFIRAFWRRIEPHKNDYDKELPEELPIEFKAHMATASILLRQENEFEVMKKALERIANPIAAMQDDAEAEGMLLNGGMAVQMANDAEMLKQWAKKALEDI